MKIIEGRSKLPGLKVSRCQAADVITKDALDKATEPVGRPGQSRLR